MLDQECDFSSLRVPRFLKVYPRRLSAYAREWIVRLWQQGSTPAQITKKLVEEDIVATRCTVTRRIFCWTKDARYMDQCRLQLGRPLVVTENITEYMDKTLEKVEELHATEIHRFIDRDKVRNEYPHADDSQVSPPEASVLWCSRLLLAIFTLHHQSSPVYMCAVMQKITIDTLQSASR